MVKGKDEIHELRAWFEDLWNESLHPQNPGVKLEVQESLRAPPDRVVFAQLVPGVLTFADILQDWLDERRNPVEDYALVQNTRWQLDAVEQIDFRLKRYKACLLSDDVGLGKTVMGTAALKRKLGRHREARAAILTPKQVQPQWAGHLAGMSQELNGEIQDGAYERMPLLNYGQEQADHSAQVVKELATADVSFVLIDEAHKLRNGTAMYKYRKSFAHMLFNRGCHPAWLLLTATPINNSFLDFPDLFKLTLPSRFWNEHGIDNIDQFLKDLDRDFEAGRQQEQAVRDKLDTFRSALGKFMIRRDVSFLNEHYGAREVGTLRIPTIPGGVQEPELSVNQLKAEASDVVQHLGTVQLLPYQYAVAYGELDENKMNEARSGVVGILRSHLAKTLQSSFYAAKQSLERMVTTCERILETGGRADVTRLESEFGQDTDTDDTAPDDANEQQQQGSMDQKLLHEIKEGSQRDLQALRNFADYLESVRAPCDEEKAQGLIASLDPERPTLVFTEYRETAEWLIDFLISKGVATFPGKPRDLDTDMELQNELLRLDPSPENMNYCNEKPSYRVYVLTDKYSEGKNFHKCHTLINYDLPWNPIRKIQRQGRIVRVGSPHDEVSVLSLNYTCPQLQDYADPRRVLREKLERIGALLGTGQNQDLVGGETFKSFYDAQKAAIGAKQNAQTALLGSAGFENESTYFFGTLLPSIEKSGFEEQCRKLINQYKQRRSEASLETLVLNDSSRILFARLSMHADPLALRWREFRDGTWHPVRVEGLSDLSNVSDFEVQREIAMTNEVDGMDLFRQNQRVNQVVNQIVAILQEARVPNGQRDAFKETVLGALAFRRPETWFEQFLESFQQAQVLGSLSPETFLPLGFT